ncbi:hypothetical protein LuPra_02384 [Luteitalea pratensis]|uniref:Uncharacterized protein n=1 Tax=Luteitalea pratensis TaxID=1855912 RepID=A0A143PL00_LUTPR|nr:hypothetical protein LuPra_02384 [Luteitalea pratensis]
MQLHSTSATNAHLSARSPHVRRTIRAATAAGLVVIAGLTLQGTLSASNGDGQGECNAATLSGRYLFANSGTALPPAFGLTVPTPSADAGFHVFNGDGTGTDTVTVRIGGTIVLRNLVTPITYSVNADCTGSYSVANGPAFDLFIAPDGNEFALIATDPPGNYPSSIHRRVSRR